MAKDKKSFIIYLDWIETFSELSNENAGKLVKHLFEYVNDLNPKDPDDLIKMCFIPIKQTLKRDLIKYGNVVKRNTINGSKGGRPKKPKKPTGLSGNPKKPKKPDSVNGSVNEEYIYNKFYDEQLKLSENDPNYKLYINFLFSKNDIKQILNGVLSIKNQLSFEQFETLLPVFAKNGNTLRSALLGIENDKKYYNGKKSLYLTLNNWAKNNFKK